MAKFKTSKVAPSKKGTNYSSDKQFKFRSQQDIVERRRELLKKKEDGKREENSTGNQAVRCLVELAASTPICKVYVCGVGVAGQIVAYASQRGVAF